MNADAVRPVTITPAQSLPAAAAQADPDSGFSFDDLIDIVNPLQHIPIVSTLYRAFTGDQIKTFPKIAGDTLYGGVEGFAGSVADTIFEKITGHNVGDTVLAMVEKVFDGPSADPPATAVAANAPATATPHLSLLARIENFFSSSPAEAPATAVADGNDAPALTVPAVVADASLDTLVIPGQDMLLHAIRSADAGAQAALHGSVAYRRAVSVHAANTGLQTPALRATLN